MEKKIIVFKPQGRAVFRVSPIYAASLFFKTLGLCVSYIAKSLGSPLDVSQTDEYIRFFWRQQLQSTFTTLYVVGKENLLFNGNCICMSNHESWMDIPAIFAAVPFSLRMVSKAGLMQVPILGRAMKSAGFVAIDRKNRALAIKQLEEAKKRLKEGISIWISPEGTRTRNKKIAPFKKGGFYLAKQLQKPIVPVFIEGSASVMPPDSLMVHPNKSITVHFLKPVSVQEVQTLNNPELMQLVRSRIIKRKEECLAKEEAKE